MRHALCALQFPLEVLMSELQQGQIDQLQQDIYDRLSALDLLNGVPVIYEKTKDIESAIEMALGSLTSGICIVVTPPVCNASKDGLPGPYFDNVQITINAVENVLVNQGEQGTKKTAAFVCELAAHHLHRFITRDGRCLLAQSITPIADAEYRVHTLKIKTAFGLK
jgi:hypothetical protein